MKELREAQKIALQKSLREYDMPIHKVIKVGLILALDDLIQIINDYDNK